MPGGLPGGMLAAGIDSHINKCCRTKDGCYAVLHVAARQAPTCTIFQYISRPSEAQTWFFTFGWISQKGTFIEKF